MEKLSRAQIWATLSTVSSKDFSTRKFGNITYVDWMSTHAVMMSKFPEYKWEFLLNDDGRPTHYYPDSTAEVRCKITIGEHETLTTLPVYGVKNKPIQNPNADEINTAKQRCRCKALAELGLFQELWSGMEFADDEEVEAPTPTEITAEQTPTAATKTADDIWKDAEASLMKAKTSVQAKALYGKFEKALKNLGIKDSDNERFPKYLNALKAKAAKKAQA